MTDADASSANLLEEALSLQARALATLQRLTRERVRRGGLAFSVNAPVPHPDKENLVALAGAVLKARSLRAQVFEEPDLFADPAWDMLLFLYVEEGRGRETRVSSLCLASQVPPTTALRWIGTMIARDLLSKQPCQKDGRVHNVTLTGRGRDALEKVLVRAATSLNQGW